MLATAMHAQPGVYALLIGSGISTGAGIPTGWGVVTNLIERLSAATNPTDTASHDLAATDPEQWWADNGDGELGYSSLLSALAPTPSARQGLLHSYFVATDDERDQGIKVPSPAHHAIAALVKRGSVKVILTTNFDRLLEQALDAAGVPAQVITRAEAVAGMTPLSHARVTIIKLHGDYDELDTRNTIDELTSYPDEWNALLGRVFAEYGLLISGWSGEWDRALVAALTAAPRRYPLYWDARSSKKHHAQQLLTAVHGHVVPAASADELFSDLSESLDALDQLAEPPLTTAMAIARLKRYLPNPVHRIAMHDLVMRVVDQLTTTIHEFPVAQNSITLETLDRQITDLRSATDPLLHLLIAGVHHDSDGTHTQLWVDVLQRLLDAHKMSSGNTVLVGLQHYPALLALRVMSAVAVHRGRDDFFIHLLVTPQWADPFRGNSPVAAAHVLHMDKVLEGNFVNGLPRWDGTSWLYPPSHLLREDLNDILVDYLGTAERYRMVIDDVEYRTGLVQYLTQESASGAYRSNSGEFVGERGWTGDNPSRPNAEVRLDRQFDTHGVGPWTALESEGGWYPGTLADYREILENYRRWG